MRKMSGRCLQGKCYTAKKKYVYVQPLRFFKVRILYQNLAFGNYDPYVKSSPSVYLRNKIEGGVK